MENKKINRILKKQIILGYLDKILAVTVIALLITWGVIGSPFAYILLVFFLIIMTGTYFQSNREKNIFLKIYKVNSYSQTKALELVKKNLEYLEESKNMYNGNTNEMSFNKGIINNRLRTTGISNPRNNYTKTIVKKQIASRSKTKHRLLEKKITALQKVKILLESSTKVQNVWEN